MKFKTSIPGIYYDFVKEELAPRLSGLSDIYVLCSKWNSQTREKEYWTVREESAGGCIVFVFEIENEEDSLDAMALLLSGESEEDFDRAIVRYIYDVWGHRTVPHLLADTYK